MPEKARVDEIASGTYRLHVPVPMPGLPAGFSYTAYLVVDDEPLLFHTGPRALFATFRDAIARVMPIERLRHVSFSHWEDDESGSLPAFLAAAPNAAPLCGEMNAMINAGAMDRPPRALRDDETLSLGARRVRWLATPHVPHGWEAGLLFEETTRTLFCSDLFAQPGTSPSAFATDVLEPSEQMRTMFDSLAHGPGEAPTLERLAALEPRVLACMHGHAFAGDGAALLRELTKRVATPPR